MRRPRLIYWIGLKWPWFRHNYYAITRRWWWGIAKFVNEEFIYSTDLIEEKDLYTKEEWDAKRRRGATMKISAKELEVRFTYHEPKEGQPAKYQDIRNAVWEAAFIITNICPESREKSLAITKLEEAVFWANSAVARRSDAGE